MSSDNTDARLTESRNTYGPITEVVVTRADDDGEILYIGEIDGTSMLKRWRDETGDNQHTRYHVVAHVPTPEPMSVPEAISWIETGPDALNAELEHEIPDALGIDVGLSEFYPSP